MQLLLFGSLEFGKGEHPPGETPADPLLHPEMSWAGTGACPYIRKYLFPANTNTNTNTFLALLTLSLTLTLSSLTLAFLPFFLYNNP